MVRIKTYCLYCMFFLCALTCCSYGPKYASKTSDTNLRSLHESELAIRELLIRHMLSRSKSFGPVFVSFDNTFDPPEGFLNRFSELRVILRPASEYYHALATGHRNNTSVVTTTIYKWLGPNRAVVGYLEYSISIDRRPRIVTVVRKDGVWRIYNPPRKHRSAIDVSST